MRARFLGALLAVGLGAAIGPALAQTPISAAFTYQGQLKFNDAPADGLYDFEFRLFDWPSGTGQVGGTVAVNDVVLVNGLFTVRLDFGAAAFDGTARWLEIRLRPGAQSGTYTTLTPRQEITASPYADFAARPWVTNGTTISYSGGDVGIGTDTPTNPLHIGSLDGLRIGGLNSGGSLVGWDGGAGGGEIALAANQDRYGNFINPSRPSWYVRVAPKVDDFNIFRKADPQAPLTSLFRVGGDGRVGIGTQTPATTLDVNGAVQAGQFFAPAITGNGFGNTAIGVYGHGLAFGLNPPGIGVKGESAANVGVWAQGGGSGVSAPALRVDNSNASGIGIFTTSSSADGNLVITNNGGPLIRGFGGGCCPVFQVLRNGETDIYGPSNNLSVSVGGNFLSRGFAQIHDEFGNPRAGMDFNPQTGLSEVFADVKAFRTPNPADDASDIWYASLEGPEAAMYVRGTGQLVNGKAHVDLPQHFSSLALVAGMTITLTPGSVDSHGLAWMNKGLEGFDVGELQGGAGNYPFDWEAKAVRREHASWRVVRAWDEALAADEPREEQWEARQASIESRRANAEWSMNKPE